MYRMNEATVDLLERIQGRLSDQLVEETVAEAEEGKASENAKGNFAFDEHTVSHLEKIRDHLDEGDAEGAGELGADNEFDEDEALNLYLDGIADALIDMGYDEDDAVDLVLDIADEMAEEGMLPPLPDEGGAEGDVSIWLGTAKTVGFAQEVLAAA